MKTEFVLFGRAIPMASRRRRRGLVALVYAGLAASMAGFWFLDRWSGLSIILLFCLAKMANSIFFGGIGFGGLVRPFVNRPTLRMPAPAVRLLRWGLRPASKLNQSELRNDEREVHQRDHAHYRAYRVLIAGISLLWILAIGILLGPRPYPESFGPIPAHLFLFGLVMVLLVVSLTLPQAILLWTEPDMEAEASAESAH
jgi:hypothetical protein